MSDRELLYQQVRVLRRKANLYWKIRWIGVIPGAIAMYFFVIFSKTFTTLSGGTVRGIPVNDPILYPIVLLGILAIFWFYGAEGLSEHFHRKADKLLIESYKPLEPEIER